jgi:hypothetical protein
LSLYQLTLRIEGSQLSQLRRKKMGFYRSEPFHTASAVYIEAPPIEGGPVHGPIHTPIPPIKELGTIVVTVKGCAPKFTGGIQLVQNTEKPGLTVDVMGWTGPLGEGCSEYKVSHSFRAPIETEITVVGSNKSATVHVKRVPVEQADSVVEAAFA